MNGSDKILLLLLGSSTVTLRWAKVPQFLAVISWPLWGLLGPEWQGKEVLLAPHLPFLSDSHLLQPRGRWPVVESKEWNEWASPSPSHHHCRRVKRLTEGPPPSPWLWKQTQEKDKERRRQEKVRIRMWKKEKEEEWTHTKARGGRKGRARGDWHLWALFFPTWHHHGPGTTSQTTSGLEKSFSKASTHGWSFKDNAHYQVDFIIYLLCWEEWVSFCKDDLSAKICFKCILLK